MEFLRGFTDGFLYMFPKSWYWFGRDFGLALLVVLGIIVVLVIINSWGRKV